MNSAKSKYIKKLILLHSHPADDYSPVGIRRIGQLTNLAKKARISRTERTRLAYLSPEQLRAELKDKRL